MHVYNITTNLRIFLNQLRYSCKLCMVNCKRQIAVLPEESVDEPDYALS